jgi:hypothetical protein
MDFPVWRMIPSHLLNLLALQASQNDPGTLHSARLRRAALSQGLITYRRNNAIIAISAAITSISSMRKASNAILSGDWKL